MRVRSKSRIARISFLFMLHALLFSLLLAACDTAGSNGLLPTATPQPTATPTEDPDATPTPEPTPAPTPTPRPPLPGGPLADLVTVALAAPVIDEETGHVHLELVVTSTREETFSLLTHGLMFNFVVSQDGEEVWRPAEATGAIHTLRFQPGEERRFSRVWELADNDGEPVEPGTFAVRGVFSAATESAASSADIAWQEIETQEQDLVITTVPSDEPEGEE